MIDPILTFWRTKNVFSFHCLIYFKANLFLNKLNIKGTCGRISKKIHKHVQYVNVTRRWRVINQIEWAHRRINQFFWTGCVLLNVLKLRPLFPKLSYWCYASLSSITCTIDSFKTGRRWSHLGNVGIVLVKRQGLAFLILQPVTDLASLKAN